MALARRIFLDRTDRLQRLAVPSQDLARIADRMRRRGVDVVDLSRLSTQQGSENLQLPRMEGPSWRPASAEHMSGLREGAAHWYEHRFGVALDPSLEITFAPNAVIGLTFLCMAFVEAGDMVLLPDPGAPFYRGAVVLCGGGAVPYHLSGANGYHPRFATLAERLVGRTRMFVMASPHNPTTATADESLYSEAVAFARKHQMLIVSDAAFAFAAERHVKPPSFLSAPFASGVGIEIAALDANFGVPGLSVALLAGNREAISAVNFLVESSHWLPSHDVAAMATHLFLNGESVLKNRVEKLRESRRLMIEAISELEWSPIGSPTVPFLWVSVPARIGAEAFCRRILRRTGVLLSPGTDFGEGGEGFVRVAIPEDVKLAESASERLRRHAKVYQRRLPRSTSPRRHTSTQESAE